MVLVRVQEETKYVCMISESHRRVRPCVAPVREGAVVLVSERAYYVECPSERAYMKVKTLVGGQNLKPQKGGS